MSFDPAKYHHHLEGTEMSDDEKTDIIQALWIVAQSFADQAFGLTPTQKTTALSTTKIRKSQADLLNLNCPANDNAEDEIKKGTG